VLGRFRPRSQRDPVEQPPPRARAGTLRIWDDPDGLVCEVRDRGRILHPLIGREEPEVGQVGGHGIWLVNLVCDLVQVRSSPDGSTVRMKMSPAA
jgi:Histidine kinase-like ATPase domain